MKCPTFGGATEPLIDTTWPTVGLDGSTLTVPITSRTASNTCALRRAPFAVRAW